jgi:hypothetical protein
MTKTAFHILSSLKDAKCQKFVRVLKLLQISLFLFLTLHATSQVDTIYSYEEMQTLVMYPTDSIYLDNPETGGLFNKDFMQLPINNGTIIRCNDPEYNWKRIIKNRTYYPEWWLPDPKLDSRQLQLVIDHSNQGDTIRFKKDKTYLIDKTVKLKKKRVLKGNNAILKRKNLLGAVLLEPAYQMDSFLIVSRPDLFWIGAAATLIDTGSPNNGKAHIDNNIGSNSARLNVTLISGDTLFLNRPVMLPVSGRLDSLGAYPAETPVFHSNIMLSIVSGSSDSIQIDSLIFDGNSEKLAINADWRIFGTIGIAGFSKGHIITNCVFRNTPSENITLSKNSIIENCIGINLGGSFVHVSNPSDTSGSIVRSCHIENVNLNTNELSGHAEGAITFSARNKSLLIENNVFINGKEGLLGLFLQDDNNLIFKNNEAHNFKSIINHYIGGGDTESSIYIDNNIFNNCGLFKVNSRDTSFVSDIFITNNFFNNSTFDFTQSENVNVVANTFLRTNDSDEPFIKSDTSEIFVERNSFSSDSDSSMIYILDMARGNVSCNLLNVPSAQHAFHISSGEIVVDKNYICAQEITTQEEDYEVFIDNLIFADSSLNSTILDNNIIVQEKEIFDEYVLSWNMDICEEIIVSASIVDRQSIHVYPNPVSSHFTIDLKGSNATNLTYSLFNVLGKIIRRGELSTQLTQISAVGIQSGIYYLQISGHDTILLYFD